MCMDSSMVRTQSLSTGAGRARPPRTGRKLSSYDAVFAPFMDDGLNDPWPGDDHSFTSEASEAVTSEASDSVASEAFEDKTSASSDNPASSDKPSTYDDVFAPFMDDAPAFSNPVAFESSPHKETLSDFTEDKADWEEDELPSLYLPDRTDDPEPPSPLLSSKPRTTRARVVTLVCAACATIVLVVCVVLLMNGTFAPAEKPAIEQKTDTRQVTGKKPETTDVVPLDAMVSVSLKVPDITKDGSRVPLHVSGTQVDGTKVERDVLVPHNNATFSLSAGYYTVRVVGSPISSEGVVYVVPQDTISVSVSDTDAVTYAPESMTFELKPIEALDVTDQMIEEAAAWIAKDPELSDKVNVYTQAARDRRARAIEKKEAQERTEAARQRTTTSNEQPRTETTTTPVEEAPQPERHTETTVEQGNSEPAQHQQSTPQPASVVPADEHTGEDEEVMRPEDETVSEQASQDAEAQHTEAQQSEAQAEQAQAE